MIAAEQHRYARLAQELEAQIRTGVYRVGERLPSVRTLTIERRLAVSTVARAFAELERRDLVEARPRSGYFVRSPSFKTSKGSLPGQSPRPANHILDEVVSAASDPCMIPFGGAILAPSVLPLKQLSSIVRELARSQAARVFASYGLPSGAIELRREIAKRMLAQGAAIGVDDVVITSGAMDAMRLGLSSVVRDGDLVAVESPCFFGTLGTLQEMGLQPVFVRNDPETGLDLQAFADCIAKHKVRAVVVTPNFQNPTGSLMSDDAKLEFLRIAAKHDLPVVEDDIYGDLQFSTRRHPPLASFGVGDVLHCGSFKTLAPGLRVGWIVPGRHRHRTERLKLSGTIASPLLNQLAIAEFLASGSYDRHLRRLREQLSASVARMRTQLQSCLGPQASIADPKGGFLLWLSLGENIDAFEVYQEMKTRGVSIMPGVLFGTDSSLSNYLRINCGYPFNPERNQALKVLGDVVRAMNERNSRELSRRGR